MSLCQKMNCEDCIHDRGLKKSDCAFNDFDKIPRDKKGRFIPNKLNGKSGDEKHG